MKRIFKVVFKNSRYNFNERTKIDDNNKYFYQANVNCK